MNRPLTLIALCSLISCFATVPSALGQGCSFENRGYFEGQVVCQDGSEMKCTNGGWEQTGNACSAMDENEEVNQPGADGPGEVQMPEEPQVPEVPAIPPATE